MVNPNWGLMQGNNALQYFQYGQQIGRDARQAQDKRTVNNALVDYMKDPNNPAALETIGKIDAPLAMGLKEKQDAQAAQAARADLVKRAAGGDEKAVLELWGMDPETASKLDKRSTEKVLGSINYISNAGFQIATLPENQRAAAWDDYIDRGVSMYPGLAQYRGKYSPEALNSIISQAGKMKEYQEFNAPVIKGLQAGEGLYSMDRSGGNIKTLVKPYYMDQPVGGAGQIAKPADKAAYDALPPGTQYYAPDGSLRIKGGVSGNTGGGFPVRADYSNFKRAIIGQESGGRYGVKNAEGSGATGIGQVMPDTGRVLAKRAGLPWRPDLMAGTSPEAQAYQDRVTEAAVQEAWAYGKGNPELAAYYYFAGPDKKKWGPKTRQYGVDILRRIGGQ